MPIVKNKIEKYQIVIYISLMAVTLSCSLLGVLGLQALDGKNIEETIYVLSKILGFSLSSLFFSISVPFYKKNWLIFIILIVLGLAFFIGTTASILYPAPGENPF